MNQRHAAEKKNRCCLPDGHHHAQTSGKIHPLQVTNPGPASRKTDLRNHMRRLARDTPTPPSGPVRDAIEHCLAAHPALRTLAVFAALPGEPDVAELVTQHPERRWVYPQVHGDDLVFRVVTDPTEQLNLGAFGIREPSADLPQAAIEHIDAFLCPGLAFDARGGRLGRGRGFYDRLLAPARPDALKIGVCFARQLIDDTFPEPHDVPMNAVIAC